MPLILLRAPRLDLGGVHLLSGFNAGLCARSDRVPSLNHSAGELSRRLFILEVPNGLPA